MTDAALDTAALIDRWQQIVDRLTAACVRAGRAPDDVTLVAVSKKHPAEAIRTLYEAGQRDFGENYAQELDAKRTALADLTDLRWHFIGALQSNKAKLVVPGCTLVHAVDRLSVAEAMSRRAVASGSIARLLVEVNVGGEASKAGVSPADVAPLIETLAALPAIEVSGLMCIPPPEDETADAASVNRVHFAQLRQLRDALSGLCPSLRLLSMGMTDDFESAVAEGATHVRIGTAIFGPRPARTL